MAVSGIAALNTAARCSWSKINVDDVLSIDTSISPAKKAAKSLTAGESALESAVTKMNVNDGILSDNSSITSQMAVESEAGSESDDIC